jgi:hypothetical protein
MAATAVYKKGETTRINFQVIANGVPLSFVGKTLKVKVAPDDTSDTIVTYTDGDGLGITNAAQGRAWWEVAQADLDTLGNPESVFTVLSVWNADGSLAFTARGFVGVEL